MLFGTPKNAGSTGDTWTLREGKDMLVLTRHIGQEIVIDGRIRVAVLKVLGKQVRLGVGAPSSVSIDRLEVHERRASEAERAKSHPQMSA